MPVDGHSLSLTPANLFIWNQHTVETLPPPPLGIQVARLNKAAYFIQINVSLFEEDPILLNGLMFIRKLEKNPLSEHILETMVISKVPKLMGKDAQEKDKICSLQKKRTRPSKRIALKHFLPTLCSSSFLVSYLKCFSFLLAQLPTGKKMEKLYDIAASCVFSETN